MCGVPQLAKISELGAGNPTSAPDNAHFGAKSTMFMSTLIPLFRRVKGFLVNLVYTFYDVPDTRANKSIEYNKASSQNSQLDIMAALANNNNNNNHSSYSSQQDSSLLLDGTTSAERSASLLECILFDLPQFKPKAEGKRPTSEPCGQATKPLSAATVQQVAAALVYGKSPRSEHRRRMKQNVRHTLTNALEARSLRASSSSTSSASKSPPSHPSPGKHHPSSGAVVQRKTTSKKVSSVKNTREKKRHELERYIHEDITWDGLDDQDTVDFCCVLEPAVIAISWDSTNACNDDSVVPIRSTSQFTCFTIDDFPAMATTSPKASTSISPATEPATTIPHIRKSITWEILLDRAIAERPARLTRLLTARHPANLSAARKRLQSECDSDDSLSTATRLSATNIQQHRALFNLTRVPRERQISECSDDFICFEGASYDDDDEDDDDFDCEMADDSDDSDTDSSESDTDDEDDVDGNAVTRIDVAAENQQFDSGFEEKKVQFDKISLFCNY